MPAASIRPRAASTSTRSSVALAPATMTISFSPLSSTRMSAVPVGTLARRTTAPASIPAPRHSATAISPATSLPSAATMATAAPQRAAATAWLLPLPPPFSLNRDAVTVSPGRGKTATVAVRSALKLPTTQIRACIRLEPRKSSSPGLGMMPRDCARRPVRATVPSAPFPRMPAGRQYGDDARRHPACLDEPADGVERQIAAAARECEGHGIGAARLRQREDKRRQRPDRRLTGRLDELADPRRDQRGDAGRQRADDEGGKPQQRRVGKEAWHGHGDGLRRVDDDERGADAEVVAEETGGERPDDGADAEEQPVERAGRRAQRQLARDEIDPEDRMRHKAGAVGPKGCNEAEQGKVEMPWRDPRPGDARCRAQDRSAIAPARPRGERRQRGGETKGGPGIGRRACRQRCDDQAADHRAEPDAGIDQPAGPAALAGDGTDQHQARTEHHEDRTGDAAQQAPGQKPPEAERRHAGEEAERRQDQGGANGAAHAEPHGRGRREGGADEITEQRGGAKIGRFRLAQWPVGDEERDERRIGQTPDADADQRRAEAGPGGKPAAMLHRRAGPAGAQPGDGRFSRSISRANSRISRPPMFHAVMPPTMMSCTSPSVSWTIVSP